MKNYKKEMKLIKVLKPNKNPIELTEKKRTILSSIKDADKQKIKGDIVIGGSIHQL